MRLVKQLWWRILRAFSRTPQESAEGQDAEPRTASARQDPERESAPIQPSEQNDGPSSASDTATEAEPQVHQPRELLGQERHRGVAPVVPDALRESSRRLSKPSGEEKTERIRHGAARRARSKGFEYWDLPADVRVRERLPSAIADSETARLDAVLRTAPDSASADAEELFMILGLDMGTSCTKAIVRLPYEAGEPAIAIPAPSPCRSGDDSYLWRTVLWLQEDGSFRAWPTTRATVLTSLKQGLIVAPVTASRAEAVVAYLAFVIRYVRGWLLLNRAHLFRGRKPVWLVNLGMPAASYDEVRIAEPYRHVGAAALRLAMSDEPVTVEATRRFYNDPSVAAAGPSEEAARELGIAVIPETAAQMTGFSKSTRRASGLYLLVDVGALTLDACMFHLNQNGSSGDHFAFMEAEVRPLGVESFYWFQSEGKTEPEFRKQCDHALHSVVWNTKRYRDPMSEAWKPGNDVPVFLAGGGAANHLHREIVESLGPWLRRYTPNEGIRLLELPVPRAIDLPDPIGDFRRMAVAWGLSYPPTDIGDIMTMSEIEDIPPPDVVDLSGRFISKDEV
ncbi:MAG: hypothetical protein OXN89_00910 [Bryobacterales bacterium]|nr:hypothetical protein [Bryobacterales bacterium]